MRQAQSETNMADSLEAKVKTEHKVLRFFGVEWDSGQSPVMALTSPKL
jgi:hypothetical protein